jgi:uncharacterized protein
MARDGLLGRLARASAARWRAVVASAALIGLVAGWRGLPPEVDANLIALLPPEDPVAAALQRVVADAGGINTITLIFEGDDRERMLPALDALAAELEALDTVQIALHRLPPELARHVRAMSADPAALAAGDLRALDDTDYALLPVGGLGRILVKPTRSNVDPDFCEAVVADVERVLAERADTLRAAGVRHRFSAGPYVYIADGAEGIRQDLVRTSGITAVLVFGVLAVGFRDWRAPLLLFAPVVLALACNLALAGAWFGALNSFTSFGTALLIGLGVDFGIHLLARFREERGAGLGVDDALAAAWDRTGPATVFAALTSAAGFAALVIAGFRGLAQLGLSLCVGLVLCNVAALVLLPALIARFDRTAAAAPAPPPPDPETFREGPKAPHAARVAVAAFAVISLLGVPWGFRALTFQHDITGMNRAGLVFSDLDPRTRAWVRSAYPPVVVPAADVAAEHRRLDRLVAAGALPHVRSVLSVASLVPDDQAERLAALRAHGVDLPARTVDDLPPVVVELVGGTDRVLLLPRGDLYDLRESSAFVDEIGRVAPGAASEQLAQGAVYRGMRRDLPRIAALAAALVALLVLVDLRRPALAAAVIGSLGAGILWAGAALGLLGVELTLMNVIGLPILLGIGVDVVLHLAHRLRDGGSAVLVARTVGRAAGLSTLTTIASFASLAFASSGGIRSVGQLVVVGLAVVSAVSGALLLALWAGARPTARPAPPAAS